MIYFYGDPHAFHFNIIKLSNRPFVSVEEMNSTLIKNYNDTIQPNDEVYFTGDVVFKVPPGKAVWFLKQLVKSKRYLVRGNHDYKNIKNDEFIGLFDWVKDYHELNYNGKLYVISHYPFHSWNGSNRGSVNVHAHSHNNLDNSNVFRFDSGVDNPACNYSPISIEYIEESMNELRQKNKKNGFDLYFDKRMRCPEFNSQYKYEKDKIGLWQKVKGLFKWK